MIGEAVGVTLGLADWLGNGEGSSLATTTGPEDGGVEATGLIEGNALGLVDGAGGGRTEGPDDGTSEGCRTGG